MAFQPLSDLGRAFQTRQHNTMLREKLYRLSDELSTGRVADLGRHLGANADKLAHLDRVLALSDGYLRSSRTAESMLATMQMSLGRLEEARGTLANTFVAANLSGREDDLTGAGVAATAAFDNAVNALNVRFGDTPLFAGRDIESGALAPSDAMLSQLRTLAAGATDAADLTQRIADWFDLPGGFDTTGYLGDNAGHLSRPVDEGERITFDVRADDPAIRKLLQTLATAAIGADPATGLAVEERQDLMKSMAEDLFAISQDIVDLGARIGLSQQIADTATTRVEERYSAYAILRNKLVSADPFETASALTEVETLLDTHYRVTARISGLSLSRYL